MFSLSELELTDNLDKVHNDIKKLNRSAANIVNLTGSLEADKNEEKVTAIVEQMSSTLDSLVSNLLLISGPEDEAGLDSIDKLLEGVEIFFDSTNPELERNNEVRS